MGRVIAGARRVPADAVAACSEARALRDAARAEAERIVAEARTRAAEDRARARADGRAEGWAQAAATIVEARARHAAAVAVRESEIADLALAVARRVIGECRALDGELVARRVASTVRERFLGPVVVRAPAGEAARIREKLDEARLGEPVVAVREDPALRSGTCVLEGDGGEIRLDDDEMLERVGRALADPRETDG